MTSELGGHVGQTCVSQASPMPLVFASSWPGFETNGQLSTGQVLAANPGFPNPSLSVLVQVSHASIYGWSSPSSTKHSSHSVPYPARSSANSSLVPELQSINGVPPRIA